jgi:hypothetical protein
VADSFKKPLFPITCGKVAHTDFTVTTLLVADMYLGDLGLTLTEVETWLATNFTPAHRWG